MTNETSVYLRFTRAKLLCTSARLPARPCSSFFEQSPERCQKPSGTFIKIITTFRQSLRNSFAAACFAFADPLHPTTSLANPFAEFLLLTSKKSISMYQQRGIIPNLQPLLSPHLREPFANLSPGYHESLDDMLCTENLFANPFATKSIHQKIRAFLQTFRQAFPNCSFPFAQIHNLKSYLNSFIEVYDVAHLVQCSFCASRPVGPQRPRPVFQSQVPSVLGTSTRPPKLRA